MADSSFDIVNKVEMQEVVNAVDQSQKEIATRYDFKDLNCAISLDKEKATIKISAPEEMTLSKVNDVLLTKLIKRNVPVKSLEYGKTEPSGKLVHKTITIQQGLSKEQCKEISQFIKNTKLKVQPQIMGDQLRVTARSKDELQELMRMLKEKNFEYEMQFNNYR